MVIKFIRINISNIAMKNNCIIQKWAFIPAFKTPLSQIPTPGSSSRRLLRLPADVSPAARFLSASLEHLVVSAAHVCGYSHCRHLRSKLADESWLSERFFKRKIIIFHTKLIRGVKQCAFFIILLNVWLGEVVDSCDCFLVEPGFHSGSCVLSAVSAHL